MVDQCAEADLRWHASLHHKTSLSLEILGEAEAALRHTATAAQQLKFLIKQVRPGRCAAAIATDPGLADHGVPAGARVGGGIKLLHLWLLRCSAAC